MIAGHTREDYAAIALARQPQVAHAMIRDDGTDYRAMRARSTVKVAAFDLSRWLEARGYHGLTADQCACLIDTERMEEASDMLDHILQRCDAPEDLVMAVRWAMHDNGSSTL